MKLPDVSKKFLFIIFISISGYINAQTKFIVEIDGGYPINIPMPLVIKQQSHPTINTWAKFYSEPFTLPVYWDIKGIIEKGIKVYEFEIIHHKLYLRNTPADVQHFGISHGFNMILFNYCRTNKKYWLKYGLGFVLAHPESTIREQTFGNATDDLDMGYYITGPIVNYGIFRRFKIIEKIYLNAEIKTTLAYSYTPIANGKAHVFNWALHFNVGIGYYVWQKNKLSIKTLTL